MMINEETLESLQDIPNRKTKFRLDIKSKVLIIQALNNGQSKSELAKHFNVTAQTISNINKKKEYLLEKYVKEHKLLLGAHQVNIDQAFLEWFLLETKCGKYINKNMLHQKALDMFSTNNVNSVDVNDWIEKFQIKHHITEFVADICCNLDTKNEWMDFLSNFDPNNVYFGGICAISHSLYLESYMKGHDSEDYVSIMLAVNALGTDKRPLAVLGKDAVESPHIKSLPVQYYLSHTDNPLFNYSILNNYLRNWDHALNKLGKNILLIVNLPDHLLHRFKFENIKLLAMRNLEYITHVLEKLIECFKFHYRRLQISNRIESENFCLSLASEFIHMIAMAWHSVSIKYIELLCSPQMDGMLYFNVDGKNYGNHSLTNWFKMNNLTLGTDQCSDILDKFINYDSKLKCEDWSMKKVPIKRWRAVKSSLDMTQTCSSLEAYQAMRNLVSYLQEQNAAPEIRSAKHLENQIEYEALTQMHIINDI